jgi:phenylacetic acid degradation operon negative regulatory protein
MTHAKRTLLREKFRHRDQAGGFMQARSLLFDLWGDYIQHVGGEVWTSTLARYLAEFGIAEPTLRQALSRMTRQGWLQSRRVAGRSCYSLTERGQKRMVEACRRVYHPVDAPWDGRWRVFCYSLPESMRAVRDDLRKELAWTGFAPLTPGTWISPNPMEDAMAELCKRYAGHIATFVASHTGPETPRELVERCWDLESIQAGYARFLGAWAPHLAAGAPSTDAACFVARIELVHDYRKFLFVDPGLPFDLLPEQWRGREARALFQSYYALLEPGARRFMDAAFEKTF